MTEATLGRKPLKKELFTFLLLTFTVTLLFVIVVYLILGPLSFPLSKLWFVSLQFYMLIPALAAITCMFAFKSKALSRETKIVFTFFLLYVVICALENYFQPILGTIGLPLVALQPTSNTDLPIVSTTVAVMGILTVIILNLKKKWRGSLEPSKLSFGKNFRYYLFISIILASLIIFTYILRIAF